MTRKPPTRHNVRPHTRGDTRISQHQRGSGTRRSRKPRVVRKTIEVMLRSDVNFEDWYTHNAERFLRFEGTPTEPLFIIDENLPMRVEYALRDDGFQAIHVNKLFRKGTPDMVITMYVEDKTAIAVTRDTFSFPEPYKGDRIVVRDEKDVDAVVEVRKRVREMGWRPRR